jgi:hypothetical protein
MVDSVLVEIGDWYIGDWDIGISAIGISVTEILGNAQRRFAI